MIDLEKNKQTVTAFYDLMFNQSKPLEAIELYAGGEYIPAQSGGRRRERGVYRVFRADGEGVSR